MLKTRLAAAAAGVALTAAALTACGSTSPAASDAPPAASQSSAAAAPKQHHSAGQAEALADAQAYLDSPIGFSKKGLVTQLKFDKFSTADAKWAAAHCGADWNKEAVVSGESYLSSMPMSKSELVTQLKFDGFTTAQAHHGASVAYAHQ